MKTVSGAKKRFDITATGRIKRKRAYHRHQLTCKNAKRKRRIGQSCLVDMTDHKRTLRCLALA